MNDPAPQTLPEPRSPFGYRVNSRMEQMRQHLAEWTTRTGLVRQATARQRFERADFGWFAAMVYPTASPSHANLMADWFAWLFLVDDQLDDSHGAQRPEQFETVVDQMRTVLTSRDFGDSMAFDRHLPAAVSSLADLWSRTAPDMPNQWRGRFVRHLEDCLATATSWEAGNRLAGIVPSEETYIPRRRHTGAIYVCMDFIDVVESLDVPKDLYDSPAFIDALHAACDVVCWTNDIYSYEKERALGEVHNLVHIVRHHHGLSQDQGLRQVRDAIVSRTEDFLGKEPGLLLVSQQYNETLNSYLAGMRTWMRGNLDWSKATKRYQSTDHGQPNPPEEYLETSILSLDN